MNVRLILGILGGKDSTALAILEPIVRAQTKQASRANEPYVRDRFMYSCRIWTVGITNPKYRNLIISALSAISAGPKEYPFNP